MKLQYNLTAISAATLLAFAFGTSPLLESYRELNMMADDSDEDWSDDDLALLDKSLDDIEDLPGFEVPVNGRYLLKLTPAIKKINEKKAVEIKMEVMECLAQDNDADTPTVVGTQFSQLFFLQGDEDSVRVSLGMLKQFAKPIAEHFQEANLLPLVREHMKDLLIAATCTRRPDKKDPEIFRARLSLVEVA